jgi:alkanesulfonate monooxygenase SsuD/methylene tetrahydromethanopterin reductase-like flavin-dependent oxidoreductase (luciferase family)
MGLTAHAVEYSGRHFELKDLKALPRTLQLHGPPLLVGGGGRRILSLAAREANIVGLIARTHADGTSMDWRDITYEATKNKVDWVRDAAGERYVDVELNITVFVVMPARDRRAVAQHQAQRFGLPVDQILASPHFLIGTVDEMAEQLLKHRADLDISYVAVYGQVMEAFAPVIGLLRGR